MKLFGPKFYKFLAAGLLVLIVVGSVLPQQVAVDLDLTVTSTGFAEHALAYALFGLVVAKGFAAKETLVILVLIGILGICLEWLQMAVLERTFNPDDILGNVLGLVAGWAIVRLFRI